jgi:hypothetical protein
MSAVKAKKAMKSTTKKSAFLLWSEEDAVMNNSLPLFYRRISTINGLVKKIKKSQNSDLKCGKITGEEINCRTKQMK